MNSNNSGFLDSIPIVTKNLLIINILAFIAKSLLPSFDLDTLLGQSFFLADTFRPHQLITSIFMHVSFGHLFMNMFGLYMFGRILESVWGPKRFLLYYMITGIFAGVLSGLATCIPLWEVITSDGTNVMVQGYGLMTKQALYNAQAISMGASGALYGILAGFGVLFPNEKLVLIPIPIPVKAKWFVLGFGIIELSLGILDLPGDNIGHFAHLGGLVVGFILLMYWKKKGTLYGANYRSN